MQGVPAFLRPGIRQAYTFSLRALRDAHSRAGETQQTRAWKLFLLIPRLLLFRVRVTGSTGREALLQRVRDFLAGRAMRERHFLLTLRRRACFADAEK